MFSSSNKSLTPYFKWTKYLMCNINLFLFGFFSIFACTYPQTLAKSSEHKHTEQPLQSTNSVRLFVLICKYLLFWWFSSAWYFLSPNVSLISSRFPLIKLQVGKCKVSSISVSLIGKCKREEDNGETWVLLFVLIYYSPYSFVCFRKLICGCMNIYKNCSCNFLLV